MLLAYFKSGDIANARILFDKTDDKDVIVWNAMLGGYVQCCLPDKALELFREMQNSKVIPNEVTLINVLSACSMMGCVEFGEWVHAYIERQFGVLSNSTVNNSLLNMYSKCGRLDLAFELFLVSQCKNLETWNTMLTGFAIHGHASEALSLFSQMIKLGSLPDSITFVVLVMAFCHRGMVDDARCCFNCMTTLYGIEPDAKHVNCMVDVLSRGGYLDEAYILIENMPFEGDTYAWGALLSGCFTYKNYELGLNVARRLLELEPRAEGRYVALLNLYSLVGRIEDAIKLRKMMDEMGIKQSSGISVIEVDGVFHGFIAGDSSHAESKDIYTMIHNILPNLDVNGQLC
ncbi:pentatricopeptide repeat-containing protein At2g22410, mitochondrial-like [Asparagus officinalis]|nr:pentatricopeptide repeat-containing protein At2g22410, mitochondrial-like [Asparagus officinalis]